MAEKTNGKPHPQDDVAGTSAAEAAGLDDGMPPTIADLAAACVRFTASRYGVPLDFSSDTLSIVDQYVRDSRADLKERPESIDLLQGAIGAYLGEVIRRAHGGSWRSEGDPSTWRVMLRHVYLAFNPVGMAREALTLEEAEGYGAHLTLDDAERDAVDARLNAMPSAEEDEFYAPTTRYEVVEIAVSALRARMQASGLGDITFGAEDYD